MSSARLRSYVACLKPGAEFHFAEHGLAPEPKIARRQERFTPWQQRFAGGCHLDRHIQTLLAAADFEVIEVANSYLAGGPKAWSYMSVGRARARVRPGPYTERSWRADRVAEGARLLSE